MLQSILDPVFLPIIRLHPVLGLMIIALIITVFTTIIHKYTSNQKAMKALKEELNSYNKEMRSIKDDPKKVMQIQKKAMEKNFEFMRHSFKPLLYTFLPLIIIFGWLNASMYMPIAPGEEFTVTLTFDEEAAGKDVSIEAYPEDKIEFISRETLEIERIGVQRFLGTNWVGKAVFRMRGPEGNYVLTFSFEGRDYSKSLIITEGQEFERPETKINDDSGLRTIRIDNELFRPFGIGWIWAYIIFSMIFSTVLRKALKVV